MTSISPSNLPTPKQSSTLQHNVNKRQRIVVLIYRGRVKEAAVALIKNHNAI